MFLQIEITQIGDWEKERFGVRIRREQSIESRRRSLPAVQFRE
jgi:hypothetical protein